MHTGAWAQGLMEQFLFLLTAHTHCGLLHSMFGHSVTNYSFDFRFAERLMGFKGAWCLLKLGSDA